MSYTIEVFRKRQSPERHLGIYALYVMFYPQLVAGPIERPQQILNQFREKHDPNPILIGSGLRLMAWGYFKKMVVADHLGMYADKIFGDPLKFGSLPTLLGIIFFSVQIYCDFSGYSDIAIGAARVMGIRLMRNFNFPYFSSSIREFWSRWHISLSTWFRDYLYIPLGGNQTKIARWCLNIMIVFIISGLWHGANWTFIIWGALHGSFLILSRFRSIAIEKYLTGFKRYSAPVFLQRIFVFIIVSFGWIFFRSKNITNAFTTIKQCVTGLNLRHPGLTTSIVSRTNFTIILASLSILIFCENLLFQHNGLIRFGKLNTWVRIIGYALLFLTIITFGVFNSSKFIYFQF